MPSTFLIVPTSYSVTVDGPMMPRPGSIVSRGSGSPKAAHCAVTIARSPAVRFFTSGASSSGV